SFLCTEAPMLRIPEANFLHGIRSISGRASRRRRHQPMRGHFGRLVTRSSFVTALLAINASSRKNPNSATLSGSEIKKLNFGGKQKYPAAKALANEVRTPAVLP